MLDSITTPLARRLRQSTTAALDRIPARARTGLLALRWRSLLESDARLTPALHRGRPVLAHRWAGPLSTGVLARRALEHCADALESAGVDYFLVNGRDPHEHTIGVHESDRGRVLELLAAAGAAEALYAAALRRDPRDFLRPLASPGCLRRLRNAGAVRVGAFIAGPGADVVAGPEHGCVVEFWRDAPEGPDAPGAEAARSRLRAPLPDHPAPGTLIAPRRNRVSDVLPPSERTPARARVGDRSYPTFPAFSHPLPDDVDFPIDAVFTWVDGDDPVWAARRDRYLGAAAGAPPDGTARSRFTARDELRYALRSLEMYAGFVRTVHIVTDGQRPAWLDTSCPRVRLVDHRDVFGPGDALPVFNSHAIETRLHRIDGLSEHYLYLNDDILFARPVTPGLFFHPNGIAKAFPSPFQFGLGGPAPGERAVDAAAKNNRHLLWEEFGRFAAQKYKHAPFAHVKEVMLELEKRFPEALERTASSRFRDTSDVSVASSLHHTYALLTGRAVEGSIRSAYVDLADTAAAPGRLARLLADRRFDTVCLNDTVPVDEEEERAATRALHRVLEERFPFASSMERPLRAVPPLTGGADGPQREQLEAV
ncbi:stealth conserved region 3 domain-containing protein [Nocardiopsis sp. RSe5-2]|uniref:Stealth conserved region 3 domain-containing protein n=1 Tax=Nocardiopsis endophytica TaxID=3018445 RepID=A0ABT4U015_9ACTN|nr:stealth family protein [Nocardiopsis endophytica]MDA2810299.1 stealth conserved region 3 domain-containing protein [Nocardiopsis endophytica]